MDVADDDGNIRQPSHLWELGVVGIALTMTVCGVMMCFFSFAVPAEKAKPVPQPTEVTVGIGGGSTIRPTPAP